MRPLKKKLTIAAAVANAAAIIGAVVLTALGSHAAKTQSYNYAADRWSSGGKTKYSQISCFFSPDANFDKNGVGGLRSMLLSAGRRCPVVDRYVCAPQKKNKSPCRYFLSAQAPLPFIC